MSETLQHLVLVRHGQSYGDVRRAGQRQDGEVKAASVFEEDRITRLGEMASRPAGTFVGGVILRRMRELGLVRFDGYFVSDTCRSLETAVAMNLDGAVWQMDMKHRLNERNRGEIRGLSAKDHARLFPDSYRQMQEDPLHWTPPGGNPIVPDLVNESRSFYEDIGGVEGMRSAIVVGHRDKMWASMQHLENLSDEELAAVNTEAIGNAHILYYTSINPFTNQLAPTLSWKWSIDPMRPETSAGWQELPNVIRQSV